MKHLYIGKHKLMYVFAFFVFLIAFLMWSSGTWNDLHGNDYESLIFPWVIASLVFNIVSIILLKKATYIDIGLIFVSGSYLFMFGRVFLNREGGKTTLLWDPSIYFSEIEKFHSSVYVIACLTFLTFGYILDKNINYSNSDTNGENKKHLYYKLGWVYFFIGSAANFLNYAQIIATTVASNSYISYSTVNTTGIFDDLAYLLVPGVVYLLSSKLLAREKALAISVFTITYFIITMIFSGSRKTQLFAILTIVLCFLWTQKRKKISIGRLLGVIVGGILLLNLIYVIRETRFNLNKVLPTFFESLSNFKFLGSILEETFAESGLSFFAVVAVVSNVPSVFPFELGMTFIRTIPSALPIGWLVGDFFNKAASTYVINTYTRLPVGASMFGDFYWNFGFIGGVICCLIFGLTLSRFSNKSISKGKAPIYFSVFYIVMMGLRAGVFELFRPLVMVTLVPYIIRQVMKTR